MNFSEYVLTKMFLSEDGFICNLVNNNYDSIDVVIKNSSIYPGVLI